jgi:hypothetical protein
MREEIYNVLEADSVPELVDLVNRSVDSGCRLLGGMTPTHSPIKVPILHFFNKTVMVTRYCQTIVELHHMEQNPKEHRVPARHRRFQEALRRST